MRDDDDFVASTDEVGTEHVYVIFYPAHVGVEEIRYHSAEKVRRMLNVKMSDSYAIERASSCIVRQGWREHGPLGLEPGGVR